MGREHDRAPAAAHELIEPGAPFDVDVLSAGRQRVGENATALFFRSGESAPLPSRVAGDDRRANTALERTGDVWISHRIEPHLDEIRVDDSVALPAELRHRGRRHGYAQLRCRHKTKKPLQPYG